MTLILNIVSRGFVIGLICASVSMMTSLWNGVGIQGGWTFALAVLLVAFTIVFLVLIKQTWDEYTYLKKNCYDMKVMTREEYFQAMQKMEDEQNKK
jgi:TRAP-type C4-dicarboxylate transport system permease small subunit